RISSLFHSSFTVVRVWHSGCSYSLPRVVEFDRTSTSRGVTTEHAGGSERIEPIQTNREETDRTMKRFLATIISVAVGATVAPVVDAQTQCPTEVSQAQAMLKKVSKAQDVQAPRSLAGARQDIQAPRAGQDIQAPRSLAGSRQDVQAPRAGQDIQAPRAG